MTQGEIPVLKDFVERLRACRRTMGLTQAEFARIGGVGLGAQNRYEQGATEPSASYFVHLERAGADVLWLLTGQRSGKKSSADQSMLLDAFSDLCALDRAIVLRLATSLAGRPQSSDLVALPSPRALTDAFQTYLAHSPGLAGDELARDLAMQLPTILEGAEGEISAQEMEQSDTAFGIPAVGGSEKRAVGRGRNS